MRGIVLYCDRINKATETQSLESGKYRVQKELLTEKFSKESNGG